MGRVINRGFWGARSRRQLACLSQAREPSVLFVGLNRLLAYSRSPANFKAATAFAKCHTLKWLEYDKQHDANLEHRGHLVQEPPGLLRYRIASFREFAHGTGEIAMHC